MRKIPYHFLLCIGILGLTFCTDAPFVYGQEISRDTSANFSWINGGIGFSSVHGGLGSDPGAPSLGGSFSHQWENKIISVRFVHNKELQLLGSASPSETVWDAGVLYGRSAKESYGLASIAVGIGVVGGVSRGEKLGSDGWFGTSSYEKLPFFTFGIPVEGQLFWTPLSGFGIGIYGFANLNPKKSFIGWLFCIQIGKLR